MGSYSLSERCQNPSMFEPLGVIWKNVKDSCFLVSWGSSGGRKAWVASGKDGNRQIFFFEILGNRVMLNSVQNHSSIPQLSIITELSIPKTLFIFVLCWRQAIQKTSKNNKSRRAVTACYLLETYVSLLFLFCQNHTPSIIFEGKTSKCEVSKIFGCCGFLCLQFLSDHISSTHGKSQGKSVWGPSFIHLLASFSRVDDIQQVFTCQRFAIFLLLQKSPIDLGVITPTFNGVKWMDRVVG